MYQEVNQIKIYYHKLGKGDPILLLHGNGESHKIFDKLSKILSEGFTVYAIDSRGHGESTPVKELNYLDMVEDIAEFIKCKDIQKPILYGFSDGGIIGLILAAKYPDMLSKLIISGANTNPQGVKKNYLRLFKLIYFFTRNPKFKLMVTQPDIKVEELNKIIIPTIVLAGSKDLIYEEHTREIAKEIPNSVLKILEGEDHGSYVVDNDKLYKIIEDYL